MNNIEKAKELLKNGDYTCVILKDATAFTSKDRGVKPLLDWIDSKCDFKDAVVADKVVGKAAAFLYVLLKVSKIYAVVLSEPALKVLESHNIEVVYEQKVVAIRNRDNTGYCPMESAVWDIESPEEAHIIICNTRNKLVNKE